MKFTRERAAGAYVRAEPEENGWHPCFGRPGPRKDWTVRLPFAHTAVGLNPECVITASARIWALDVVSILFCLAVTPRTCQTDQLSA